MNNTDILVTGFNINEEDLKDILIQEFDIPETHNRKFVETKKVNDYEVLTDSGWTDIYAIGKTVEYDEWFLKTETKEIICADKHLVFLENFEDIYVERLKIGDRIHTDNGLERVLEVYKTDKKSNMYDLQLPVESKRRFFTNGILSHNSMWLQNMSSKVADQGANVAYITLEMGKQKVMKRLGSMRLKIPSKDYDEKSKDQIYMKMKINQLINSNGGVFNNKPGKIFVKKYNTSDCTVADIDLYIKKLEEAKKLKIHVIVVDYLNIMGIEKGLEFNSGMLYLKGKHLAEGLRYIADKHNCAVLTATQVDKSIWGGSDVTLNDIPESKAIAETADSVFGIIRNPEMKKHNLYRLKLLKLRDGEHSNEQVRFSFNTQYLLMENDEFVDNSK